MPFDSGYWSASFPELSDVFARISPGTGSHFAHAIVRTKTWHRGKIVILGDAAHGQPPNLGQGAGMAISNAKVLAECLDKTTDIELGLRLWEKECLDFTCRVQSWSIGWEHLMHRWPVPLGSLRSWLVLSLANYPPTRRRWKSYYRGLIAA